MKVLPSPSVEKYSMFKGLELLLLKGSLHAKISIKIKIVKYL